MTTDPVATGAGEPVPFYKTVKVVRCIVDVDVSVAVTQADAPLHHMPTLHIELEGRTHRERHSNSRVLRSKRCSGRLFW
jgi:hypothetical protein